MSFELPKLPFRDGYHDIDGDEVWGESSVKEYGAICAKYALEEVAKRMKSQADATVAKWEAIGDDEATDIAKAAGFAIYVHAAQIMTFAAEITE